MLIAGFLGRREADGLTLSDYLADTKKQETDRQGRRFAPEVLISALDIFENSRIDQVGRLTTKQLTYLSGDLQDGLCRLYPMDKILGRLYLNNTPSRSGFSCVDMLRHFVTPQEFLNLKKDAESCHQAKNLESFRLIDTLEMTRVFSRDSALLSILAEIAVSKGIDRYIEVAHVVTKFVEDNFRRQALESEENSSRLKS